MSLRKTSGSLIRKLSFCTRQNLIPRFFHVVLQTETLHIVKPIPVEQTNMRWDLYWVSVKEKKPKREPRNGTTPSPQRGVCPSVRSPSRVSLAGSENTLSWRPDHHRLTTVEEGMWVLLRRGDRSCYRCLSYDVRWVAFHLHDKFSSLTGISTLNLEYPFTPQGVGRQRIVSRRSQV